MKLLFKWLLTGLALLLSIQFLQAANFWSTIKPYGGIYGGLNGWNNNESLLLTYADDVPNLPNLPKPGEKSVLPSQSHSANDAVVGVLLGVRNNLPHHFVVGAEFNLGQSLLSEKISSSGGQGGVGTSYEITQKFGSELGLSGWGGYSITPKVLGYVKLGYVLAQFIVNSDEAGLLGPTGHFSTWTGGLLTGAGLGYRLTDRVSLRVEYQHISFSDVNITGNNQSWKVPGQASGPVSSTNKLSSNRAFLIATYRF